MVADLAECRRTIHILKCLTDLTCSVKTRSLRKRLQQNKSITKLFLVVNHDVVDECLNLHIKPTVTSTSVNTQQHNINRLANSLLSYNEPFTATC